MYSWTRIPLTRGTSAVAEMIVLFGESRVADVMFSQRYTAILSPTQDERAIAMFSVHELDCEQLQEAPLSPCDRAMRLVSSNLANYHATVQKLLIRQVLTKPMV